MAHEHVQVLLVEDDPGDARLLRELLVETVPARFELTHVERLDQALRCLGQAPFDVVLLDLSLSDAQGLDSFVRVHAQTPHTPIIVMTGLDDETLAVQAVRRGAQDYLLKAQVLEGQGDLLVRAIRYAIERKRAEAERERLLAATRRQAEQLEALRQVSQDLVALRDLDTLLRQIVERAMKLLGGETAGLYLYRPEREVLEWVVGIGSSVAAVGTTLQKGEGLSGRVWEGGEPLIVADYGRWAGKTPKWPAAPGAVVGVPVQWGDDFLGVLNTSRTIDRAAFTPEDALLLSQFAAQAAIAIRNARLYERAQQEIAERRQAETALRQSEERWRTYIEHANDLIFTLDLSGKVTSVNRAAYPVTGYTAEEWLGKNPLEMVAPESREATVEALNKILVEEDVDQSEVEILAKDGRRVLLEIRGCFVYEGERFVGTFHIARDVTERVRAEEQIRASLREKEVLLQEIHHRVKNNLQIISSLLNLQSERIQDQPTLSIFQDSQNRIRSMSLIHEKLYRSENLARIDLAEYVKSLTAYLFRSYTANAHPVTLKIDAADVSVGIDTAVPLGLILNELVSNALKHAFPNGRQGEIRIALGIGADGQLDLGVADDGVGFADLDFRRTSSLGLQLVTTLVNQLGGAITVDGSSGAAFAIRLPGDKEYPAAPSLAQRAGME